MHGLKTTSKKKRFSDIALFISMKKKKNIYHIWFLESPFDFPIDIEQDYESHEQAYDTIANLVHQYDNEPYEVVGCVDLHSADGDIEETIDYVENFNNPINT